MITDYKQVAEIDYSKPHELFMVDAIDKLMKNRRLAELADVPKEELSDLMARHVQNAYEHYQKFSLDDFKETLIMERVTNSTIPL